MTSRHHFLRLAGLVFVAAVLFVRLATAGSLGSVTASVINHTDQAGAGSLSFTHTYQSTSCSLGPQSTTSISCSGSIAPTSATSSSGPVTGTDAIKDTGTVPASGITEQVMAPSCGQVQIANQADSSNVMLPRYGTTFSPSSGPMSNTAGSITLDGSSGYASDVVSQTQPNPGIALGDTYALGIWFETSSTTGGPLFEIANSPVNTAGGDDRVLYMNANGTLSFIQNTSGTKTTTTAMYNNGAWHFAYVTMTETSLILGLTSATTIYVDGANAASGGGLLEGYSADSGYWHVGWAPTTVTGLAGAYWNGSLSNFVVFDTANAPGDPSTAQRASQSAFNTWAASGSSPSPTEQWEMNDTGTTTFSGTDPTIGGTSPCTMVSITWGFTSPTSCAASPQSTTAACTTPEALSSFASGAWQTVSAPGPGVTQTSTISLSRGSTYNAYISGLHLYAPLSWQAQTTPGTAWSLIFSWPSATAAFIA